LSLPHKIDLYSESPSQDWHNLLFPPIKALNGIV